MPGESVLQLPRISSVHSGDVAAVETQLKKAITDGDDWVTIEAPDGVHHVVRITPNTDVVLRYT